MFTVAVIPLGGAGERLFPLTVETSKAMVRFLNRPLVEFVILELVKQGVKEVYLGVNGYHNYKQVYDYLGEGFRLASKYNLPASFRIRYQPNIESVGNADSVRIISEYYSIRQPLVVVQCDNVFESDLHDFWTSHTTRKSFMTISLYQEEDPRELTEFGVAIVGNNDQILGFIEKPKDPSKLPSKLVNTGIYALSDEFLEFLSSSDTKDLRARGEMDFGSNIIPKIVSQGKLVHGYRPSGYWFDVGTPSRYMKAVFHLLTHLTPSELDVSTVYKGVRMQGVYPKSETLHKSTMSKVQEGLIRFEGDVMLGRHVSIGNNVSISDAVIDNYTIIENGVKIKNSVIMDRCNLGSNAIIEDSIVGRHVRIGSSAEIQGSIVGDDALMEPKAKLISSKIWPHKSYGPRITQEELAAQPRS